MVAENTIVSDRENCQGVAPWRSLRAVLRQLGVCTWYRNAAGKSYEQDPWGSFALARMAAGSTSGSLRTILDIFLDNCPIRAFELVNVFGDANIALLEKSGIIRAGADGRYRAELCLVVAFGELIFTDWPFLTRENRLISRVTYLSSASYDCARFVGERGRVGRALDLGCGNGLVSLRMSRHAEHVVGIDIDERACWVSSINHELAESHAEVVRCDWGSLTIAERFDLIVANPPWRIVPPGVRYPDSKARVGTGPDGLGQVAHVVKLLPSLLSEKGVAAVRFDVPVDDMEKCPFDFSPDALLGETFAVRYLSIGETSVQRQSKISADSCEDLNPQLHDLAEIFAEHYSSIGVKKLQQVLCVIQRQ